MVLKLLDSFGPDACAAAARLLELPDTIVQPLGPLRCPVLLIYTQRYRDNGALAITTKLLPQATVHEHAGQHFTFITKHSAEVGLMIRCWPHGDEAAM